jgi:hypothetical protein
MCAAVDRFIGVFRDSEDREWDRRSEVIAAAATKIPTISTEAIVPPIANRLYHSCHLVRLPVAFQFSGSFRHFDSIRPACLGGVAGRVELISPRKSRLFRYMRESPASHCPRMSSRSDH